MGFYFQDDYWNATKFMSVSEQKSFVFACVLYAFEGEIPKMPKKAEMAFLLVKERIDLSKTRSKSGAKGGKQNGSKTEAKCEANHEAKREAKSDFAIKSESESENTCTAAAASNVTVGDSSSKKSFIKAALEIYNSEFSTSLKRFGAKVESVLGEAYDAGYTLDDIALLVEFDHANGDADKRSPNGIFGDHFEVLIAKAKSWKAKQEEIEHSNHTLRVIAESSPDAWMQNYEVQA